MQKYGQCLSDLWKSQNMEDISAKGKHVFVATRIHPNGIENKLDCIVVSSDVARDLKAKVTLIKPVTMYREDLPADWSTKGDPQNYTLSDHSAVIMRIKRNCQLRIKIFVMSESYKLSTFLCLPRKQKQFTSATNKLGNELSEAMHLSLDEINKRIVEGLRIVSKAEVGIGVSKRAGDTRVYTDVKEVTTALRASRNCSTEVHSLEALGGAVAIQTSRAELRPAKKSYFRAVRNLGCKSERCMTRGEGSSSRWMLLVNLRCYTP